MALKERRGSYVVFDLEATGQNARAPETEIIQIAAERWVDGKRQDAWATFVRTASGAIPAQIVALTHISEDDTRDAPDAAEALRQFLAYVGDLPLIAHNGASYDGPLVKASCTRLGIALPETFLVLDTLPLARVLFPAERSHTVSALAKRFDLLRDDAHRADADVDMLAGIVRGLQRELHNGPTGAAVYELLRRAGDPWADVLEPPKRASLKAILATFGANLAPLFPERASARAEGTAPSSAGSLDAASVEALLSEAKAQGYLQDAPQIDAAILTTQTLRDGGSASAEAPAGVDHRLAYVLPAALAARAWKVPVALSTYSRVAQAHLLERALPLVQSLVPGLTYTPLQGRTDYLSLPLLAEELEDALAESSLPAPRAWMLAALVRFAAQTTHGTLDELGFLPRGLDDYLHSHGAVQQTLAAVRVGEDDATAATALPDFYGRAQANAQRADLVIINHTLLLRTFLINKAEAPFFTRVICDEAQTLEEAATLVLGNRVDERALRRLLRALYDVKSQTGLVAFCRSLGLAADDPLLLRLTDAVESSSNALDALTEQLQHYVATQPAVPQSNPERAGVRVVLEASALAADDSALRTTAEALGSALQTLQTALFELAKQLSAGDAARLAGRQRHLTRLARLLLAEVREQADQYRWFWSFQDAKAYTRFIELGSASPRRAGNSEAAQLPVSISAVPNNIEQMLRQEVWSRLDALIRISSPLPNSRSEGR